MTPPATLLIEHLDQLYPIAGPAPRTGARQGDARPIAGGAIAALAGSTIVAARIHG